MIEQKIPASVYKVSSMVIVPVILSICLVCKWPAKMIVIALLTSAVISSPAMLSLQAFAWLSQKIKMERSFAWALLLSSVPVLCFIVAWVLADYVPGKTVFIFLLGMLSSYAGFFSNGVSIAQFFKSSHL